MIMELSDSTGGERNLNAPPPPQHNNHHQDARAGLGIDLNEIPSPSSLFAETLPDSVTVDVVRAYHDNPGPPPGAPAAVPSGGLANCAACSKPCPAAAGSHHHLVVCDGCERGFHLACAGIRGGGRQAASLEEWVCGECVAAGVKSKRWPLGVKQLLDINAPPPSEAEGDGVGDGDSQDLRFGKKKLLSSPSLVIVMYWEMYVYCLVFSASCGVKLSPFGRFFSEVVGNELV
ncbi:hypothetical protein ACSQ67_008198 [Phaseolus vulgaris]